MSKNKKQAKPQSPPSLNDVFKPDTHQEAQSSLAQGRQARLAYLVLFLLSCLLYANTAWNKYAIDDGIVITENQFTQKGLDGIQELITHDAFAGALGGYSDSLVQGGRYRPLSLVSFAIEYQLWGQNPAASHIINILLFALAALLVYYLLNLFSPNQQNSFLSWPFWAALLFVVHPIHTEVVANIKGRDEILSLLFSVSSLILALKFVSTNKTTHLIAAVFTFFLALLSKENAITFLAIIPLSFYFLTKATKKQYILTLASFALPVVLFLYMRALFAPSGMSITSGEIMNNPFAAAVGTERIATTLLSWLYYFKLLLAPVTLTHDYYFNQIPYVSLGSPIALLSLLLHVGLLAYALKMLRNKNILSYAILYYFISFSVVSNLLFSVGILMNERFMFMPSLGFCIAIAYLLQLAIDRQKIKPKTATAFLLLVGILFSVKTFSRNFDWKNNLSLLAADVQSSPNSAKANSTYGGLLYEEVLRTEDTLRQNELLALAYEHLSTALAIYPNYSDALQLYGNVLFRYKKDYKGAIAAYQRAMEINTLPNAKLLTNLAIAQLRNGTPMEAKENLVKSNSLLPNQYNCVYSLGEAYDNLNVLDSALFWYQKSIASKPGEAIGYYKVGALYGKKLNKLNECLIWLNKAVEKEPNNLVFLEDLSVAKGLNADIEGSIAIAQRIIQLNPQYRPAYNILSASYLKKGDPAKANEYLQKAAALR